MGTCHATRCGWSDFGWKLIVFCKQSRQKDSNLANGQFILISRDAYDEIGRHAVVQNNILDDVGIARALVDHDKQYHCLYLDSLFRCRMYTAFAEIWEGWTKNLFAGLRYSIPI